MEGRTMPPTTGWPDLQAVCLVKVPDVAPPYDCQVHGARCPEGAPDRPDADAAVTPFPPVAPSVPAAPPMAGAPGTTAAWPRQMAVAIVETLAGLRPDRQLVPLTTDRVRARIRGLAPLLRTDLRPRIARIVTSRPVCDVVEVTVVVDFGSRSRALAMRFEHAAGRPATPGRPQRPARWLCTAIEAG
jgi:Family of unknown function (DUF6459)